jgi:hypothetical protein
MQLFEFLWNFPGGIFDVLGLVCVLHGLRGAPPNHTPVLLWRIHFILAGLGYASIGAFIALGYTLVPFRPAQNVPLLGWVLWVLICVGLGGYFVMRIVIDNMISRVIRSPRRQLAQGEPPYNS